MLRWQVQYNMRIDGRVVLANTRRCEVVVGEGGRMSDLERVCGQESPSRHPYVFVPK